MCLGFVNVKARGWNIEGQGKNFLLKYNLNKLNNTLRSWQVYHEMTNEFSSIAWVTSGNI